MTARERNIEIVKRIAAVAFAVAFAMTLVIFAGYGRSYISVSNARIVFLVSGGIGLFLNLLTYESGKRIPIINFMYWAGSIVLFTGIIMNQMRIKYAFPVLIAGAALVGISIFLPTSWIETKKSDSELLDD